VPHVAFVSGRESVAGALELEPVATHLQAIAVHRAREFVAARRSRDRTTRHDRQVNVGILDLVVAAERADGP
jgi:hypothetical protein